jgi:glutamyl-tRNA(Gln) amidotransferase subunit D
LVNTGGTVSGTSEPGLVLNVERDHQTLRSWAGKLGCAEDLTIVTPLAGMSENFSPHDWHRIVESVNRLGQTEQVDAIVVLHGTDTMTYSAAAAAFVCADLQLPIVFTGANSPYELLGSDGPTNLAAAFATARVAVPGVYVVFAGSPASRADIHLATRARKVHAGGRAYRTVGGTPIGSVDVDGSVSLGALPLAERTTGLRYEGFADVVIARSYPGCDFEVIRRGLEGSSVTGVVLVMYPSATVSAASGRYSAVQFAEWCGENDIAVVAVADEPPAMNLEDYESTAALRGAGAIVRTDLLPEVAYVKLSWLLGAYPRSTTRRLFEESYAGEYFHRECGA